MHNDDLSYSVSRGVAKRLRDRRWRNAATVMGIINLLVLILAVIVW